MRARASADESSQVLARPQPPGGPSRCRSVTSKSCGENVCRMSAAADIELAVTTSKPAARSILSPFASESGSSSTRRQRPDEVICENVSSVTTATGIAANVRGDDETRLCSAFACASRQRNAWWRRPRHLCGWSMGASLPRHGRRKLHLPRHELRVENWRAAGERVARPSSQ